MTDPDPDWPVDADKLDSEGEDPAAESGAGYGSHAPDADNAEERSKNAM